MSTSHRWHPVNGKGKEVFSRCRKKGEKEKEEERRYIGKTHPAHSTKVKTKNHYPRLTSDLHTSPVACGTHTHLYSRKHTYMHASIQRDTEGRGRGGKENTPNRNTDMGSNIS